MSPLPSQRHSIKVDGAIAGPSLAIIFLPSSSLSSLPENGLYLPVICDSSLFSQEIVRESASYSWGQLQVPLERVLVAKPTAPDSIVSEDELEHIDPRTIADQVNKIWEQRIEVSSSTSKRTSLSMRRYASGISGM